MKKTSASNLLFRFGAYRWHRHCWIFERIPRPGARRLGAMGNPQRNVTEMPRRWRVRVKGHTDISAGRGLGQSPISPRERFCDFRAAPIRRLRTAVRVRGAGWCRSCHTTFEFSHLEKCVIRVGRNSTNPTQERKVICS